MPHVHAHRGRKRSHLGDAHQLLPCAPPSPTPPPLRVARAVHERRGLRPLAALPAPSAPLANPAGPNVGSATAVVGRAMVDSRDQTRLRAPGPASLREL